MDNYLCTLKIFFFVIKIQQKNINSKPQTNRDH